MILRRLIQHFDETNWFLVVVDLLVVLFGLWGAFELENWNIERRERVAELALLSQLHDEIVLETPDLEQQMEGQRATLALATEVAQILSLPGRADQLSPDQCRSMLRISIMMRLPLKLLSLREMVGAGGLSSMRDLPLRGALLRLNGAEENALSNLQLVRAAHWVLVDHYPELLPRGVDESGDAGSIINCDAAGMKQNPAFRNHLISDLGRYGGMLSWESSVMEALEEVHLRLDDLLSIDHPAESSN